MCQIIFLSFFRNKASLIAGIAWIILTCSCTKDDPQPLFAHSVIKGGVSFYNGYPEPVDIKVTAHGPYGNKSALTDSSGNYEISGLGNGTYELEFAKKGYGTKYHFGIQLFGNNAVVKNEMLYEKMVDYTLPIYYEVHDYTTFSRLHGDEIGVTTNQKDRFMPVRIFLGSNKNVNYLDYEYTLKGYGSQWTDNKNNNLLIIGDLWQFDYEGGQEVFFIVYVCNPEDPGYVDSYLRILRFSTLEKKKRSAVMRFKVPKK